MARAQSPNSAGSQFFIMVADAPHLDGQYASFGMVIEGQDVADRIVNVKRNWSDKPKGAPGDEKGHRGNLWRGLSRTGKSLSFCSISLQRMRPARIRQIRGCTGFDGGIDMR